MHPSSEAAQAQGREENASGDRLRVAPTGPDQGPHDLGRLLLKACTRWLAGSEVCHIIGRAAAGEMPVSYLLPATPPRGGEVFVYSRAVTKHFRKDGISWSTRPGSRQLRESHERLQVPQVPGTVLSVYYCASADGRMQRRCYWRVREAEMKAAADRALAAAPASETAASDTVPAEPGPATGESEKGSSTAVSELAAAAGGAASVEAPPAAGSPASGSSPAATPPLVSSPSLAATSTAPASVPAIGMRAPGDIHDLYDLVVVHYLRSEDAAAAAAENSSRRITRVLQEQLAAGADPSSIVSGMGPSLQQLQAQVQALGLGGGAGPSLMAGGGAGPGVSAMGHGANASGYGQQRQLVNMLERLQIGPGMPMGQGLASHAGMNLPPSAPQMQMPQMQQVILTGGQMRPHTHTAGTNAVAYNTVAFEQRGMPHGVAQSQQLQLLMQQVHIQQQPGMPQVSSEPLLGANRYQYVTPLMGQTLMQPAAFDQPNSAPRMAQVYQQQAGFIGGAQMAPQRMLQVGAQGPALRLQQGIALPSHLQQALDVQMPGQVRQGMVTGQQAAGIQGIATSGQDASRPPQGLVTLLNQLHHQQAQREVCLNPQQLAHLQAQSAAQEQQHMVQLQTRLLEELVHANAQQGYGLVDVRDAGGWVMQSGGMMNTSPPGSYSSVSMPSIAESSASAPPGYSFGPATTQWATLLHGPISDQAGAAGGLPTMPRSMLAAAGDEPAWSPAMQPPQSRQQQHHQQAHQQQLQVQQAQYQQQLQQAPMPGLSANTRMTWQPQRGDCSPRMPPSTPAFGPPSQQARAVPAMQAIGASGNEMLVAANLSDLQQLQQLQEQQLHSVLLDVSQVSRWVPTPEGGSN